MAYKNTSTFIPLLISTILLVTTWQAVAGRNTPMNSKTQDKKEPEWFFHHDGHLHIPGVGPVGLPPQNPFTGRGGSTGGSGGGGSGAAGSPSTGRSYVPGGDDTFVPNPGFEVPNPGSGGGGGAGIPAPARP